MYGWELKALFTHGEDQINALIEDRVTEMCRLNGMPVDDPFDLKYLNKPAREVRPCLIYPLMMCEYGLEEPCTDCPHWKEIDGE